MTNKEIEEIINNSKLNYSNINIQNGKVKGHITVLLDENNFTNDEIKELQNLKHFYLDEFEIDINKYYKEALNITRLNEKEKITYYDVEFKFKKNIIKEVA